MEPVASIPSPSLSLLGSEPFRAAMEYLSHQFAVKRAASDGDGHPVVIFPGLAADAHWVGPLRNHCRSLGYAAFDWGRGFNTGPQGNIDAWLAELAVHVSGLLSKHEQPATLIGWSLGGLYARELGKLLAPRIRQVITIGTPFNAATDSSHVGWLFRLLSGSPAALDPGLSLRLRTPPPVPTTSIYSRSDGVVAWQTCRHDTPSKHVQDIEVDGSHIGMSWNQAVLRVVANRLAQPADPWHPYTPDA